MKDSIKHIEYKGKEYPLVFNLNVMEEIQKEYKTIEKWGELTEANDTEIDIKALKFGITAMINEGIDIENDDRQEKEPFVSEKFVGRLITELGIQNLQKKTVSIVVESTKIENDEKNV